jgi:hypothetical protein
MERGFNGASCAHSGRDTFRSTPRSRSRTPDAAQQRFTLRRVRDTRGNVRVERAVPGATRGGAAAGVGVEGGVGGLMSVGFGVYSGRCACLA